MSMSSSVFRQKQSDFSADIQDLRQQNRILYQQNLTLKRSLQQLITINTQLTESIQQFNNSHVQNFPHINQQQIEQLAHQVIQLQQQLDRQRAQSKQLKESKQLKQKNEGKIVEQMVRVVEELVSHFKEMQVGCKGEVERLTMEIDRQQEQWNTISTSIEHKLTKFQAQYSKLLANIQANPAGFAAIQAKPMISRKQMKISTTIEDLKQTLDKQIQEKNKVIKMYEHVLDSIKEKLNEKI